MGEKTEAEGGGNQRARSARLAGERKKKREQQAAYAKRPMTPDSRSDRQQMADMSGTRSAGTQEFLNNQRRVNQTQDSIEELTARRDDTRNPITRMNLDNQIRELKAGGTPVTTEFARGGARAGEILTVGVVRGGRYSGRQGFDPGSGNVRMNPNTGTYQSVYGRGGTMRSDGSERATKPATTQSTAIENTTNSTVSSGVDESVRLAQLSTAAAGRKRRIFTA
jgi:hypothetical protein